MKKEIIRIGDRVRIVIPKFVVRVGYPFGLEYAENNLVSDEEKEKIRRLLGYVDGVKFGEVTKTKSYRKILHEVCLNKLKQVGFGGNARRIHIEEISSLKDTIFQVSDKRVVKTGDYMAARHWDDDYAPAYLSNCRAHVLLSGFIGFNTNWNSFGEKEIEVENVEKVTRKEEISEDICFGRFEE